MVKHLQIIVLCCGVVGSLLGLSLLYVQSGRGSGDNSSTLRVNAPCLDANGEPTC